MQKTTLLDFVTKLSELAKPKNLEDQPQKTTECEVQEKNEEQTQTTPTPPKDGENSLLKSYNPFDLQTKARPQLNMPRSPKPTKEIIDLSLSKNRITLSPSEGGKNMIELINRHNAFASRIKRGNNGQNRHKN